MHTFPLEFQLKWNYLGRKVTGWIRILLSLLKQVESRINIQQQIYNGDLKIKPRLWKIKHKERLLVWSICIGKKKPAATTRKKS